MTIMVIWLIPSAANDHDSSALKDESVDKAEFFDGEDLVESSGLAMSNREPGIFWSHNDSGGKPRLFAVDTEGKSTGQCQLHGIEAHDWEDMASFVQNGTPRLIVGDCGDNQARRKSISLLIFDEPNPEKSSTIESYQELIVTYSDGPQNCEAIAVDASRQKIFMITKTTIFPAGVYELPLPKRTNESPKASSRVKMQARRVASLPIGMISGMDLHAATGDIYVIHYFHAFHFPCGTERMCKIADQMRKVPKPITLPKWKQIEAIALDSKKRVWLSSEGSPAPFGRLKQGR